MIDIKRIPNEKYLGVDVIEINGFPKISNDNSDKLIIQDNINQFRELINEFSSMMCDESAVMEILWITTPVKNKGYNSDIKIYIIVRKICDDRIVVKNYLDAFHYRIITLLVNNRYDIKDADTVSVKNLINIIEVDSSFTVNKHIKYSISPTYQTTLFYCDVFNNKKLHNFESLISILSGCFNCALSFQIFPNKLSVQEKIILGEIVNYYRNIHSGRLGGTYLGIDNASEEAVESVAEYYNKSEGLLKYNISVYGKKNDCLSVINSLNGLLTNIKEKNIALDIMDIRGNGTSLYKDFYTYPWNTMTVKNNINNYSNITTNADFILKKLSQLVTDDEVVSYFRLPFYNKNTLALKENQKYELSESLDESVVKDDNIQLGTINTLSGDVQIGCAPSEFTKHALIVGTPGTGKTTFSLNLLLQFYRHGIPFLAIEPTKTEYRSLLEKINDLQIFTPGNNEISPFIINPFIPPNGIKVEQYIPALVSAFNAAFSMPSPLDVIFLKAIRTSYTFYGWKDYSKNGDKDVVPFGLYEFIMIFKRLVKESNYARETKGNLESAGTFRLMNLIEQNGNIYDTTKTIPIEDLLTKPTVVELNAIQDNEQKSLIMALLLSSICVYTKIIQKGDGQLKNAMLIDEAHVLLDSSGRRNNEDKNDPNDATVKSLQSMVAEIRSYGTSIIIADQSVKKVSREIVANTDIKVVFRLVEKDEKDAITNSINGNQQTYETLSKLRKGQAFVFWSAFNGPQLINTPDIRAEEGITLSISDEMVLNNMNYWKKNKRLLIPFNVCDCCKNCKNECDYYIKSDANHYAGKIFYACKDRITNNNIFAKFLVSIPQLLEPYKNRYNDYQFNKLVNCTRIFFRRKVQIETDFRVSEKILKQIISEK